MNYIAIGVGAIVVAYFAFLACGLNEIFREIYEASDSPAPATPKPICLDCIEYGAPYDAPCDECGRRTAYTPSPKGKGNAD